MWTRQQVSRTTYNSTQCIRTDLEYTLGEYRPDVARRRWLTTLLSQIHLPRATHDAPFRRVRQIYHAHHRSRAPCKLILTSVLAPRDTVHAVERRIILLKLQSLAQRLSGEESPSTIPYLPRRPCYRLSRQAHPHTVCRGVAKGKISCTSRSTCLQYSLLVHFAV